jgi:hypothetical protein
MSYNVLLFLFFIPVVLRGLLVVQVTRFGKEYLLSGMARGYTSSLIPRVLGGVSYRYSLWTLYLSPASLALKNKVLFMDEVGVTERTVTFNELSMNLLFDANHDIQFQFLSCTQYLPRYKLRQKRTTVHSKPSSHSHR